MTFPINSLRVLALAALLCASGASNAVIQFVGTPNTVPLNTTGPMPASRDTFSDLTINTNLNTLVLSRSLDSFRYTVGSTFANPTDSGLYTVAAAGTLAVSTGWFTDSLIFTLLSTNVLGFGGNFFGTNLLGEATGGGLTITATDTAGLSLTSTIAGGSLASFAGFVSDVPLRLISVRMTTPNINVFATADNILVTAVPEPSTWMLMLAGSAVALQLAKRRRKTL